MYTSKIAVICTLLGLLGVVFMLAEEYPHAFPRKGATKIFENERVFIWDATWPNGVTQPIHQHKYDMTGVFVRYGPIKVTALSGKATVAPPFEVPNLFYQTRGVTHKEEAIGGSGDPEREGIMIDIKEYAPGLAKLDASLPTSFPREGAKDAIDNARVRVWDYTFQPKKPVAMHLHDKDSVEVFFEPGTLLIKTADGKEETKSFARKDVRFIPRGQVDSEEALDNPPRVFVFELK